MTDQPDQLQSLMEKTANGDRGAFRLLYEASSAKLFGVLLRILKEQALAEEVAQEVYLTIWQKARSFNANEGRVMSWMIAIARNRAIDVLRSADQKMLAQKVSPDQTDAIGKAEGLTLKMPDVVEHMALETCLEEIEQRSRECVLLAYHYGLSRDELAARYQVPSGTVKSWLRRALTRLKDCLER